MTRKGRWVLFWAIYAAIVVLVVLMCVKVPGEPQYPPGIGRAPEVPPSAPPDDQE